MWRQLETSTTRQTMQANVHMQPVGDISELQDRRERTNNVVIYGIPESTSDETTIRNNHDEISCKEIYVLPVWISIQILS